MTGLELVSFMGRLEEEEEGLNFFGATADQRKDILFSSFFPDRHMRIAVSPLKNRQATQATYEEGEMSGWQLARPDARHLA